MFKFDQVSMEKFVPVKGENQGSPHGNQNFSKLSQYFFFNFFLLERYVFPLSNEPLTSIIGSLGSAPYAIELVDPPSWGVFQYPCSYEDGDLRARARGGILLSFPCRLVLRHSQQLWFGAWDS